MDDEAHFRELFDRLSRQAGALMASRKVGLTPEQVARAILGVAIGSLTHAVGDRATVQMLRAAAAGLESQLPTEH